MTKAVTRAVTRATDGPTTPGDTKASQVAASKPARRAASTAARAAGSSDRSGRGAEKSDVLVSAVISTYLLTHLHHVLQRAEFAAAQEGHKSQASNYAQLRKVLCLDARTMEDASASEQEELDSPCAA
ncbi:MULTISPECIES: hypothetical protein [Synechococcales]|uniref:hypothetical protein n=1 Tax=Synechococcus sp. CS-1333 TaxID=2848638 RepID=UPI00223BD1B8|nr:hypothetical protein [Synechococcus sp. CS-1333]